MASFRLKKVATDFNVGIQTLVDYLAKKGHQVDTNPNTKISEEQYELLATAFRPTRLNWLSTIATVWWNLPPRKSPNPKTRR